MVWLLPVSLALFLPLPRLPVILPLLFLKYTKLILASESLYLLTLHWKDLPGRLPLSFISVQKNLVCQWGPPRHQIGTVPTSLRTTCSITTSRFLKNTISHHLNSSCTLLSLCPLLSIKQKPRIRARTLSFSSTLPWAKKTHSRSIRNTNECLSQVMKAFLATWSPPLFMEKEANGVASGGHKLAWAKVTPTHFQEN